MVIIKYSRFWQGRIIHSCAFTQKLTFGTKTRQSVMVLQKMITSATMQNWTLGWSLVRKDTAAPMMHMMPTLYTLIPMYLLSLRAGMLTFLVSHARKQPNNCHGEESSFIRKSERI